MNRCAPGSVDPGTALETIGAVAINRTMWTWARLAVAAAVLVVLVAKLGTGPFMDGLRLTSVWSLATATVITALTTLCCAWRWRLVAERLGVPLSRDAAVAAYYRSQFLNATLPGGVLGDLHRAVRHGHDVGDLGPSLRSVAWERTFGQVVQVALTGTVIVLLPSPMRADLTAVVVWSAIVALAALMVQALLPARLKRVVASDLRRVLRSGRARVGISLTSALAATGHLSLFLVAARVAGTSASVGRLLPLAAVVLLASAVPTNIAGWGPREGVAAWAFGAAGLGAAAGVTTAVVYGVMTLVAVLPGGFVLVAGRRRRFDAAPDSRMMGLDIEEVVHG